MKLPRETREETVTGNGERLFLPHQDSNSYRLEEPRLTRNIFFLCLFLGDAALGQQRVSGEQTSPQRLRT
jgi:hypothetical protein